MALSRCVAARLVPWAPRSLPLCRALSASASSSLRPHAGQTGSGDVLPHVGTTSLGNLSDRSGFLPKPEVIEHQKKTDHRGKRALALFFLCNAIPFGGLLYYLREQREERAQLSLSSLPLSASDVVAEALRCMRTASSCFFQRHGDASGDVLLVDPHQPEAMAYVVPTTPLPILPQEERNAFTDIFESPSYVGLGFVHFAVSRNSSAGKAVLAGDRQAHLMYLSPQREAYCTVNGQLSVLSDPETRRRYWKSVWAFSFPNEPPPSKANVSTSGAPAAVPEAPSPWLAADYLLLRLAVNEVSLHTIGDGPSRWQARRARRVDKGKGSADDAEWSLVAPGAV